jgi:CTP:molybdopterin cytidylyltransferase MocA
VRIAAVILAAGAGTRVGGPKALLTLGGQTFLARLARLFDRPGLELVLAVLGHQAERVAAEAGAPASLRLVGNPRHAEGMLTSVWAGLEEAERAGAEAVLLHPVDHPLVSGATIDRVAAALAEGALLAVPSFADRRGHPGGFARAVWPELRAASPEEGARAVLRRHPSRLVHVPGEEGCVAGIDTPEDYARLVGGPA